MSVADEVSGVLQRVVDDSSTMHRLEDGEGRPGATEREMIELLISMSNALSTVVRMLAEQIDLLRAAIEAAPKP